MRRIELDTARQVERAGHTSKGDQPKWLVDNIRCDSGQSGSVHSGL